MSVSSSTVAESPMRRPRQGGLPLLVLACVFGALTIAYVALGISTPRPADPRTACWPTSVTTSACCE